MKLKKKIIIQGKLTLLSGLHIGDSKENVEIGGVDSPIIRRKNNNQPYIPGSSLKGKIRSLLEVAMGANADTSFKKYSATSIIIAQLFGWFGNENHTGNPSRILVRDAILTAESADLLERSEFTDMPYSEVKFENVIDRLTGTAKNGGIRQIERVPAGAEFDIEFVINVMEDSDETAFISLLKSGIALLEHDYLGGSGTRGYGQVSIKLFEPIHKTAEEYLNQTT
ncbi:type III-A CRISPR-associated RAMP protein Csm3 [Arcicella sp. LKC2W]|uniref:type III-A CRISPR-associated RAMP protein Csm3 n=1 Tax=Arcicella sp. LKC2W TaxID=2984198 RepID=UPI002B1F70D3|nr:type III-A CRISPR-associated RAMP protein Csm3 [Arcicella sp. LKC2W]MEA5461605.1 type III-A CRISPR-associated RAMP protein Csm3 [Arcicella sp. LKC2W]